MKVIIADKVDPGCRTILEGCGLVADEHTALAPPQLLQIIDEYDGLIVRSSTNVTEELIGAARKLRVIGRAGTGVDNIDVGAATRRGLGRCLAKLLTLFARSSTKPRLASRSGWKNT